MIVEVTHPVISCVFIPSHAIIRVCNSFIEYMFFSIVNVLSLTTKMYLKMQSNTKMQIINVNTSKEKKDWVHLDYGLMIALTKDLNFWKKLKLKISLGSYNRIGLYTNRMFTTESYWRILGKFWSSHFTPIIRVNFREMAFRQIYF